MLCRFGLGCYSNADELAADLGMRREYMALVHSLIRTDYANGPLGPAGMARAIKANQALFSTPGLDLTQVRCVLACMHDLLSS